MQAKGCMTSFAVEPSQLSRSRLELPGVRGGGVGAGGEALPRVGGLRREPSERLGPCVERERDRPAPAWPRPPAPPRRGLAVFLLAFLCRYRAGEIVLSAGHVESRWAK